MSDNLENLKGVGSSTADKLEEGGYTTYEKIAVAAPRDIEADSGIGSTKAKKIIRRAKEKTDVGNFKSASEVYERRKKIGRISFLYDEIDRLFGEPEDTDYSGVQTQAITEFYGGFGSGKSQITHQLCVNVQLPDEVGGLHGRPIFIDTEESFRPGRIRDMIKGLPDEVIEKTIEHEGVEDLDELVENFIDRILFVSAENSNHQILLGEKVSQQAERYEDDEYPVRLLIVDSVMGNLRPEYQGRAELGERQRKLNKHVSDLTEFAKLYNSAVVFANQVVANPNSQWGGDKPIGGHILGHNSTYRVKITKSKKNKRKVKMADAPDLPKREIVLRVKKDGIKPE